MTPAERQRAYRARQGADVGGPRGPKPTRPHGTLAAHRRHLRHGEQPCAACVAARAEYDHDYYVTQRAFITQLGK